MGWTTVREPSVPEERESSDVVGRARRGVKVGTEQIRVVSSVSQGKFYVWFC